MSVTESQTITLVEEDAPAGNPDQKLCSSCKQLNLSKRSFIIDHGTANTYANPSQATESAAVGGKASVGPDSLNSGDGRTVFARLGQAQEKRHICRLCDLVWRAVDRFSNVRVQADTQLFVTWKIDGRRSEGSDRVVNCTRRLQISWNETNGKQETVYLVLVAAHGDRGPRSDKHAASATQNHFLGRGIVDHREKQALIKSWIDLCMDKHSSDCRTTYGRAGDFKDLVEGTYFGVIDVHDMQLKALPVTERGPARYVALSYVWGRQLPGDVPYQTTRGNVMVRIQHGGLETVWDQLPRTIQDAFLLVSRLGEKYLWIDALCIVQDSPSSWELNAKAMHLVYGNAYFTICAADGDARSGLRAVDSLLRSEQRGDPARLANSKTKPAGRTPTEPPQTLPTPPPSRSSWLLEQKSEAQIDTTLLTAEYAPGIQLLVSRPPEAVIQDSPWNQRGWTFQERLLSRRCLIFAEGQVYFQCRTTVISENIYTDGSGTGWSLDGTRSPLRTLGELRRRAFWFYMKCILLYTGRHLSKPEDVLTAFQGTSWLLEQQMSAPLFFGLPSSHFDLAILWSPLEALDRRRRALTESKGSSSCRKADAGTCQCKDQEEAYSGKEFPSWSWCGWQGGKAEYKPEMIDGCFPSTEKWLKKHTWIRWYIRDYEGNLRPLWSKEQNYQDHSQDARWRGYAGKAAKRVHFRTERHRDIHARTRYNPRLPPGPVYLRPVLPSSEGHGRSLSPNNADSPTWHRQSNTPYLERLAHGYYQSADAGEPQGNRDGSRMVYLPTPVVVPVGAEGSSDARPPGYYTSSGHARPSEWLDTRVVEVSPDGRGLREQELEDSRPWSDKDSISEDSASSYNSNSDSDLRGSDDDLDIRMRRYRPGDKSPRYVPSATHDQPQRSMEDEYGRPIRRELHDRNTRKFTGILPDNPFGILRGPFDKDATNSNRAMPILQFWTWRTKLAVSIRRGTDKASQQNRLCQCNIADKAGDWCGSIVLPSDWIGRPGYEGAQFSFIALSDAKAFTAEECPVWTYYIPKEREESEWDLYYIMLLERRGAFWERVAIGKAFRAAFGQAVWDEIKLG